MSVREPLAELEEKFFRLPRAHRDLVEYLCKLLSLFLSSGVCFAKIDILSGRSNDSPVPSMLPILASFLFFSTLSTPHLLDHLTCCHFALRCILSLRAPAVAMAAR